MKLCGHLRSPGGLGRRFWYTQRRIGWQSVAPPTYNSVIQGVVLARDEAGLFGYPARQRPVVK